jgi:hypothetical protein
MKRTNKRVKTCNKILEPILNNDLANIITNMLPTEEDRFRKIYNEYVDDYGSVYLDRQYECGCFRLTIYNRHFYCGEEDFSFECTNHKLEDTRLRN